MEGYIYKWLNIISGFKPRYAVIKDKKLELSNSKEDTQKKHYDLSSAKIQEDKKPNHFSIELNGKKMSFKTYSSFERSQWLNALYQEQSGKDKEKDLIERERNFENEIQSDTDLHRVMCDSLYNIQNNVFELNIAINTLNNYILSGKGKKDITLLNLYEQFVSIKQHLRSNVDDTIKTVVEFNGRVCGSGNGNKGFPSKRKSEVFYEAQEYNDYGGNYDSKYERYESNDKLDEGLEKSKTLNEHKIKISSYNNNNINKINISNTNNANNNNNTGNSRPVSAKKKDKDHRTIDTNTSEDDSSFEDCEDLANTDKTFGQIQKTNLERQISLKKSDFELFGSNYGSYFIEKRTKLPFPLKSSNSMISDMVKSAMKEKASLPITYNEPLSMLQRQVESFQFYNLLESVYTEDTVEMKLACLAGFITSEISLNINRLLKPFNPILGETYEYVDTGYRFRAFSEQVSHHPPISAYILESKNITVYGDSKSKHKFQFMKGAMEMVFSTNTHVLVHSNIEDETLELKKNFFNTTNSTTNNTNSSNNSNTAETQKQEVKILHHFTFGKPIFYFKGLVYGTPHYDFTGKITIEDINRKTQNNNDHYHAELEFLDESKKKLGAVEGAIFRNKELLFTMKGNWKESLNLYSKDGKDLIKEIWRINPEESYITNTDTINNYMISNYAVNLNYLPDILKEEIPASDSRNRPDQRMLELGNIERGEELKKLLEEKQRRRAKAMESEKRVYKPMYFEVTGDETGAFYIPCRDYWKDRKEKSYEHINDVFDLEKD